MSNRSWTSASWYRVSGFRPRLRAHAAIHRHVYRGKLWFVLQDRASGRFHRFTPEAYRLIAMMDGSRSLDQIWELAVDQLEIDAVTQEELVRLVGQLYSADVLAGDVPPDVIELSDRGRRTKRQKLVRSVLNPLALRVPVFDPDDFLSALMPLIRPLFSIFGLLIYLGVVAYGLVLAALNWGPLTANVFDRVVSTENVILLLLAYPAVKAVHELGHAFSIKRWGGAVHEIGVMFLVFMPVPYVDASDSIAFASKWRRAFVAAAGVLVEIFLASVAMIVWSGAEEGLVRAFAFNVMLIGGVSTLLFNGNPLLRFDGYYVLSDLIEIPNLGQRANRYIGYLVQRFAFGMEGVDNPATGRREGPWLFFYAIGAFLYRLFITMAIISLVATKFFVVGILLASWALFLMLGLPILKGLWFVLSSPMLRRHRGRAFLATGGVLAALAALLMAVPVPHNTLAEGVVAPAPGAYANASSEGVIEEVFVAPGDWVETGAPILRVFDPLLPARADLLRARLSEIELRRAALGPSEQTQMRILEEEIAAAEADLALTEARIEEQVIRAPAPGRVILPEARDLVGRFARRGDRLAVVAPFEDPEIRVIVPEAQADLVAEDTRGLAVRFASDPERVYPAHVLRATPSLTRSLPSEALAVAGGGQVSLDPEAPRGRLIALESFYQVDLAADAALPVAVYGDRVHVRFSHGNTPLAARLWRGATRVFLKYFRGGSTIV
ncbi:HlyD family efflux transporter periplasmic adaptor subunit [Litorisediminicola beolgyonensis]|uniref:HlyD family efflux transporter periplasmic adaptor subunit n=1 Tax=Litorisediminicola beolgyonensis TaxID=1173614 RepID=A0ABW3ZJZ7_9RHOB